MATLTLRLTPEEANCLAELAVGISALTQAFAGQLLHALTELEAMEAVARLDEHAWQARELMSASINPVDLIDL